MDDAEGGELGMPDGRSDGPLLGVDVGPSEGGTVGLAVVGKFDDDGSPVGE